jgi:serine/threonine protein kinase
MEYLDGVDLKHLIAYCKADGLPIPLKVILDILEAVSSAMYAAYHEVPPQSGSPLKLIHRDIKPSNIMLTTEGEVKILDFGTAQASFDDREAATVALTFGSAGYMAPERLLLDEKDRPSGDVYSLGVTLYELLTCKRFGKINPFQEKFEQEVDQRIKVCESDIERYELDMDVREALLGVLRSMLSYSFEERPDLQQTLNLMETLSSKVSGISLRKFCRTIVAACKEKNKPEQNKADPLAGTVIHEDSSRAFSKTDAIDGMDISLPIEMSNRNDVPSTMSSNQLQQASGQISNVSHNPNMELRQRAPSIPQGEERNPEPTWKQAPQSNLAPQPSKKSKLGLIIAGVVFLGIGIAGAVVGTSMLNEKTDTASEESAKNTQEKPKVTPPKEEEISKENTFDLKATSNGGTITFEIPDNKLEWIRIKGAKKSKFDKKIQASGTITLQNAPEGKYEIKTDTDNLGTAFKRKKIKDCTVIFRLDKPKKEWSRKDITHNCK